MKESDHNLPISFFNKSLFLQSDVIFEFIVENSTAEPILSDQIQWIDIKISFKKFFKGEGFFPQNQTSNIKVKIPFYYGLANDLPAVADQAIWINEFPKKGSEWVMMLKSEPKLKKDASSLFSKENMNSLYKKQDVINDLNLIFQLEKVTSSLALISKIKKEKNMSFMMADYIWQKTGQEALSNKDVFSDIQGLMHLQTQAVKFYSVFWTHLSDALSHLQGLEGVDQNKELEFLRSTFEDLEKIPQGSDFFVNLTNTFLPNWLGIDSVMRKIKSKEIFLDQRAQDQALEFIKSLDKKKVPSKLYKWFMSEDE